MPDPTTIVRTGQIDWSQAFRGRHPFNPASEIWGVFLGGRTGLKRAPVNIMRLSPGKESFMPHAHTLQEEWVFVLEGSGEVTLDGERHAVGAGDFVAFPTDGVVHHLTNTGAADLVYLTGGEHTAVEVARFPTMGKVGVFTEGAITYYDEAMAERIEMGEFMRRASNPQG